METPKTSAAPKSPKPKGNKKMLIVIVVLALAVLGVIYLSNPTKLQGTVTFTGACCTPTGCSDFSWNSGTYPPCWHPSSFLGRGTSCADDEGQCPATGACCVEGECSQSTRQGCGYVFGNWYPSNYYGDGSDCDDVTCPPMGACCITMTDICEEKLERKCSSGLWHEGGECPSDDSDPSNPCKRKPCCSNDGSCSLDHESECDDQGGTVSDGEDCGPNPCPGACCTTDGSCSEDSQVDCLYLIDYKSWYEGGSCDPTPCPGTCCASDGGCTETKQEDCAAWGSEWSEGGSCSPNECPQPGACCVPEGMGCSMYLETDCDDVGGTFQGDGTSCDPDPCEYACCDAAASCSLATYDDCEDGGDYIEGSDTCETDTCPKGACCRIADGQCAIANEWHCEEDEDYSYDGSDSCTPNPCEQPPSGSSESSQSSEGQESTPDGGADDDTSGDDDSGDDDMPAE